MEEISQQVKRKCDKKSFSLSIIADINLLKKFINNVK